MTVPMEYRRGLQVLDDFLADAADEAGLATRNQSYTMVQAVFQTFRRRLTHAQSIVFVQTLPAMLRALYVSDWDPAEMLVTSWDEMAMIREVQSLRRHHNFAPATAIRDVGRALRRHVDPVAFEACLSQLPHEAKAFWLPDRGD